MAGKKQTLSTMITVPPAPTPPKRPVAQVSSIEEWAPPRWETLERKDARLRRDQMQWLTETRKRLNQARGRRGERITENTLIRIAIDLLRTREADISGVSEEHIASVLGLPNSEIETPK